jgi:hypothetical protein
MDMDFTRYTMFRMYFFGTTAMTSAVNIPVPAHPISSPGLLHWLSVCHWQRAPECSE